MDLKDGLLLVDKEPAYTSHDVVQRVRRIVRQKKTGHCGTLDPDATGLLLLTLGRATRLTRFLIKAPKVYTGTIRFGITTDTYDAAGKVVAEASTEGLTAAKVAEAMKAFVGTIDQVAPAYSAKKVQGRKLYELARKGEEVPRESKEVVVYAFEPLEPEFELVDDSFEFRLSCASGTYARSLAHDLGETLGCGAHLSVLRRLQVGNFSVDDSVDLQRLSEAQEAADTDEKQVEDIGAAWIPFDRIALPFGKVTADAQQERRILHGQTVLIRDLEGEEGDWIQILNARQEFIAVGNIVETIGQGRVGLVQPKVVFK